MRTHNERLKKDLAARDKEVETLKKKLRDAEHVMARDRQEIDNLHGQVASLERLNQKMQMDLDREVDLRRRSENMVNALTAEKKHLATTELRHAHVTRAGRKQQRPGEDDDARHRSQLYHAQRRAEESLKTSDAYTSIREISPSANSMASDCVEAIEPRATSGLWAPRKSRQTCGSTPLWHRPSHQRVYL